MHCNNCMAQNRSSANFCDNCGNILHKDDPFPPLSHSTNDFQEEFDADKATVSASQQRRLNNQDMENNFESIHGFFSELD